MVLLYKQGNYLLRQSKKEEALKVMQFNAQTFPEHYLPNFGLSRVHEKLGNTKEAIESCEKALKINPDYNLARNLLKQLKDNN
jgi:tetratricopeptide (TPR) repeat protein